MDNNLLNESLEEIENDYWKITEFPTGLVEKCFYLRKKKLKDMQPGDLRVLATQKIGLRYTIPLSLDYLKENILIDAGFYEGDLLEAILNVPSFFCKENSNRILWNQTLKLLEDNDALIASSSKTTDEIKNDLLEAYSKFRLILPLDSR